MEDDEGAAKALRSLLRKDYAVEVAGTVKDAYAAAAAKPFNWLLLDLMLPDGNGVDVFEYVKTTEKPPKVIIMTGCADDKVIGKIQKLQPTAILHKPFTFPNLLSILRD